MISILFDKINNDIIQFKSMMVFVLVHFSSSSFLLSAKVLLFFYQAHPQTVFVLTKYTIYSWFVNLHSVSFSEFGISGVITCDLFKLFSPVLRLLWRTWGWRWWRWRWTWAWRWRGSFSFFLRIYLLIGFRRCLRLQRLLRPHRFTLGRWCFRAYKWLYRFFNYMICRLLLRRQHSTIDFSLYFFMLRFDFRGSLPLSLGSWSMLRFFLWLQFRFCKWVNYIRHVFVCWRFENRNIVWIRLRWRFKSFGHTWFKGSFFFQDLRRQGSLVFQPLKIFFHFFRTFRVHSTDIASQFFLLFLFFHFSWSLSGGGSSNSEQTVEDISIRLLLFEFFGFGFFEELSIEVVFWHVSFGLFWNYI